MGQEQQPYRQTLEGDVNEGMVPDVYDKVIQPSIQTLKGLMNYFFFYDCYRTFLIS